MSALSAPDFDFVSSLAYSQAAIILEPGKEYLVEARLTPLAQREGFTDLSAFIAAMRKDRSPGPLQAKAVDALTTNETYFFRDFHPFDAMRRALVPELIEKRADSRKLTIWCAACSTGQEPYSIAMLLREHFPQLASWQIEIIATDFSPTVLVQAQAGRYNQIEVNRGLPAPFLIKYFTQQNGAWVIKPEIRQMVQFKALNLVQPWPILPPCDFVFIRNVMIYFNVETKRAILKKLRLCLRPHGSLFLGSSETTLNLDPHWAPVTQGATVVYRPAPAAAAAA
ncbi:CheR family methyltransferase [Horticoccus sp. 23ND18S-11]|uniref:CheR family methyltransferase n=1 Tax=Horticoccus sp. 23ND18S-11 TaxID=3391832 RepID=UPI0039C94856